MYFSLTVIKSPLVWTLAVIKFTELSTLMLLQEGVYYRIGQLMAMAFVHGGAAVHIISQSVYNFLTGMKPCDIIVGVHEIPDASVWDMLQKVNV